MGRRSASTFKKRQREMAKKEKQEAKVQQRKERKVGSDPEEPAVNDATDYVAAPKPVAGPPAVIRLSDLTLPSRD